VPDDQILGEDAISARLHALAERLGARFGDLLEIRTEKLEKYPITTVSVLPQNPKACSMSWIEMGQSELIIGVGRGGRWEELRDIGAVDFLEQVVAAVTDGRVVEVFGPGRSRVTVTFADGTSKRSSVGTAPTGCLPAPFWPRWGRKVTYSPYD
jgi:hypothetical protein